MPVTRMQFERQAILMRLLNKKYTKNELLVAMNRAMRERHDDYVAISSRTLANDLKYLKEKYGAEINRPNKTDKYYYFTEQLVVNKENLSEEDIEILSQAQTLLQSLHGVTVGTDMKRILSKINAMHGGAEEEQVIAFENHQLADGIQHLDNMMQAIMNKKVFKINYTSFTDDVSAEFAFSPYFLKEYRGRWFVFGYNHEKKKVYNLSLSGITKLKNEFHTKYEVNTKFNPSDYFQYLIGVTVLDGMAPEDIEIKISKRSARYITSKKLISNQETIKEYANGDVRIRLKAYINYELKQNLLGFGAALRVIKPQQLANEMEAILQETLALYQN
jgi:predicted DNA-binding transcriptional regulator YafY